MALFSKVTTRVEVMGAGIRSMFAVGTVLAGVVSSVAGAAEVSVVGGTCVRVDGTPFFPIGVYSAGDPRDFAMLAEAGFNTVQTYSWEGERCWADGEAWLDGAHAHGLKCLVGLYRADVKAMNFEATARRIETYRDHPALLAWHTMDEPEWDEAKNQGQVYMPAVYALIKEHDPNHPVTAVVCRFRDTRLFQPSVDVLQADYYPVPPIPASWYAGKGFRGVQMYAERWREACGGTKPFWYVGQVFDFSVSKEKKYDVPDEWKRPPTREELRCMTYTAVASGARGIFYWSLLRVFRDEWNRTVSSSVRLWEDLKSIVDELNTLMPLLTADTPETIQNESGVVSMVKSDGAHTYIIVANYERKAAQARIRVPGLKDADAEVLFEGGKASVVAGTLEAGLAPIESHVYRVGG